MPDVQVRNAKPAAEPFKLTDSDELHLHATRPRVVRWASAPRDGRGAYSPERGAAALASAAGQT